MIALSEGYLQLMSDPAHVGFELTYEVITGLVVYPVIRFAARKFHRDLDQEHGVKHKDKP